MKINTDTQLEPEWDPLVQILTEMITSFDEQAADNYAVLACTPRDQDCVPYVQTCRIEDTLHLEAVSNAYLDTSIGPDALNTLLELGWNAPKEDTPNFNISLDAESVESREIAKFLISTLRDVYLVTTKDSFKVEPRKLFVEIIKRKFGVTPPTKFTLLGMLEWERLNPLYLKP